MHSKTILAGLISLILFGLTAGQPVVQARQSDPTPPVELELVGTPFTTRLSGTQNAFARNVWDMEVFEDRLYLAHGNSDADSPGERGPVEVWYYDGSQFAFDFVTNDEQIDRFRILQNTLTIPGHDSRDSWAFGNIYRLASGQWQTWENISDALHIYDVAWHKGQILAALGIGETVNQVIVSSRDQGQTWQPIPLVVDMVDGTPIYVFRAWTFFEVGNDLLVSVVPAWRYMALPDAAGTLVPNSYQALSSEVFRLERTGDDQQFVQVDVDFFLGIPQPEIDFMPGRVIRPTLFESTTVYIGARTTTDHNWTAFGLFAVDDRYQPQQITFEPGEIPNDILVDDALYVLLVQPEGLGYRTRVMATCDLQNWREVLAFDAATFARSFALYQDAFYFGLGTEAHELDDSSGTIVRVNADQFTRGC